MILIGIGSNLPTTQFGPPRATCGAALSALNAQPKISIIECSYWYRTAPVPLSDQPWYVNAVAAVDTALSAEGLMAELLSLEKHFGRQRGVLNAARVLDLDLIAYNDHVVSKDDIQIPHPRLEGRAFVLYPLRDVAPSWRHPVTGSPVDRLIAELPAGQDIEAMAQGTGVYGTEWAPSPRGTNAGLL